MTPSELPQHVLAKLFALQSGVEAAQRQAAELERAVAAQRELFSRRPASMRDTRNFDLPVEQRKLDALVAQHGAAKQVVQIERDLLAKCRAWLEALPSVALETVSPALGGQDNLQTVRARLQDLAAEVKRLQSVPLPDPDLKGKVEAYVTQLAARAVPELRGVAAGETFQPRWRFDSFDEVYPAATLVAAWL